MSSLLEVLAAIADAMYGVEQGVEQHGRSASFSRATDIEPFVGRLEEAAFRRAPIDVARTPSVRARRS
jgi:hypothetical protein